MPYVGMH